MVVAKLEKRRAKVKSIFLAIEKSPEYTFLQVRILPTPPQTERKIKMNKIQEKRFRKLINFLKTLPEEKFSFNRVISRSEKKKGAVCGTVCCAMGWTPALFPKIVKWGYELGSDLAYVNPKGKPSDFYPSLAFYLFGIPRVHALLLFTPNDEIETSDRKEANKENFPKGIRLNNRKATPKSVARTLEKYLEAISVQGK